MKTTKKLAFGLILLAFLAFLPTANAAGDNGRHFVKSTSGFWKNALGVRHNFVDGFTTDASDFQLRLAKVFGVGIEPVTVFQILPDEPVVTPEPRSTDAPELIPSAVPASDKDKDEISAPSGNKGKTPPVQARYLPSDQTPWGIEVVYNNPAITYTSGGEGVRVAVLDSGVYSGHPDLKARVAQCKDFTHPKSPLIDGKCEDKNGHGTHVAGIIAADGGSDTKGIYGVAPQAELWAYKVCGNSGSCYADDIAAALYMASDQGVNIVNMSFGSDRESLLIRDAISYAVSRGVLPIAAAGNDGPFEDSIDYPAAYSSVVGAGALNNSLKVADWSSRGNNYNTEPWVVEDRDIEFATPGEYVESTWNNGGYVILSGTSMASPFAAGLAAKFWQSGAENPMSATRDYLRSIANDLLPLGDDDASGFGLPQVK